jgi:hypothetical protein
MLLLILSRDLNNLLFMLRCPAARPDGEVFNELRVGKKIVHCMDGSENENN